MTAADAIAARHPYRWLMLTGASLVYACFGALMASMAVLVKPISDSFALTPFQAGTLLAAWQFVYLFASIPTGAFVDRFGLRPCLLLAGIVMAASAALRVVAPGYAGLLAAVMLFGLGGPLISVGAPKLVGRWFAGAERGLAMGIYMSSTGVGALLATITTNSVIMPLVGGDWRGAFGVYTLIMLASVAVWTVIASHPASRLGQERSTGVAARLDFAVFPRLLADRYLRSVLLMAMAMFFFVHSLNAWLPEILRAKGLSLIDASYWAGLPAVIAIVATLVVTRLALPHRRMAFLIAISTIAIAATLLLEIRPVPLLAACLIVLGIARSCLVPIAMLLLIERETDEADSVGAASGLFFTAGQVGGVLGPLLCGALIDATGNYDTALWAMAAVLAVLLAMVSRRPAPAARGPARVG